MTSPTPENGEVSLPELLRSYYHVLIAKAWLIATLTLVCSLLGLWFIARSHPVYAATTTIQLEADQQRVVPRKSGETAPPEAPPTNQEVLKTLEQSLANAAVCMRLVRISEFESDPAFLPNVPRPAPIAKLVGALQSKITARVRPGTQLIDITVEDENPVMAQRLAQVLVDEFVRGSAESRVRVSQLAHEFLSQEAERLKVALTKSERALQQYKEEHQAVSLEESQNIVVERLKELNATVTGAKSERLKLEGDVAQFLKASSGDPQRLLGLSSVASSEEVSALKTRLGEKENQIAGLRGRYKAEHPKFIQAAGELAELQSALNEAIWKAATTVRVAYEGALVTEKNLEEALRAQEQTALELSGIAIPYQELVRDLASNRALYESLLARLKEVNLAQGAAPYSVFLAAPALVPDLPISPNKRGILLLSICAGLTLGMTYALAAHVMDDSFTTVAQAEAALGLTLLGAIPKQPQLSLPDASRLILEQPHSAFAESFGALRTAIHFKDSKNPRRTLLFTSAIPGEGKTFCSLNCAVSLAQQGMKTLLIDADLRLPSLGTVFLGGKSQLGLSEVLLGEAAPANAIYPTPIANLFVMPAGARLTEAIRLPNFNQLSAILNHAGSRFERIIFDTAPVLAASETLSIAEFADLVCLVVRANQTPRNTATRALQRLRESGARVVGFLYNGLSVRDAGYCYHYYAAGSEGNAARAQRQVAKA